MKFDIFYRRPDFVPNDRRVTLANSGYASDGRYSTKASPPARIPPELSFDKILSGDTRSPCTLQDFMNYCLFVEYSAENLQFFLWLRGYRERFNAAPQSEKELSPMWTTKDQTMALQRARADLKLSFHKTPEITTSGREIPPSRGAVSETASIVSTAISTDFNSLPMTPASNNSIYQHGTRSMASNAGSFAVSNSNTMLSGFTATSIACESFANAGLSEPFTVQPFRSEIDQIIANYISHGSPRELNLSGIEKRTLLIALQKTTHPSVFDHAEAVVLRTIRNQSHPNFIRSAIRNCSAPRRIFCLSLAVFLILCGIILSTILTLSSVHRGWRAFGAIFILMGVTFLIIAGKGICPIVYGLHHRQLLPWELFPQDDQELVADPLRSYTGQHDEKDWPFVTQYAKRNVLRKIFDRENWIQEKAVRRLQDQISLQAFLLAIPVTGLFLLIFLLVPGGRLF